MTMQYLDTLNSGLNASRLGCSELVRFWSLQASGKRRFGEFRCLPGFDLRVSGRPERHFRMRSSMSCIQDRAPTSGSEGQHQPDYLYVVSGIPLPKALRPDLPSRVFFCVA